MSDLNRIFTVEDHTGDHAVMKRRGRPAPDRVAGYQEVGSMDVRGITSRGKLKVAGSLLALTVGVGAGGAAVYAAAPGGTPATQKPDLAAELAKQLNVSPEQFLAAEKAVMLQRIDARVAAGTMTAAQAQQAKDRIDAAANIRLSFGAGRERHERGGALMAVRRDTIQAVATKLGITPLALETELRAGKSLAQVAQARNVTRDELKATMRAAVKADLDKAVAAGKLTQAREDALLAKFDQNVDKLIDRERGSRQPAGVPGQ